MRKHSINARNGFTVVEISLVMAFIALLILAVLFVSIYAGRMYAKGLTLKNLNQTGRAVTDMVRLDFMGANPNTIQFATTGTAPNTTGRLCLGTVSYLWNSAALINVTDATPKIVVGTEEATAHLVRVQDSGFTYCTPDGAGAYPMKVASLTTYSELLTGGDADFAVYGLISEPYFDGASTGSTLTQGLFRVQLTLGTNEEATTEEDSVTGAIKCKVPTDNTANFDYCSVRDFDIIVSSGGKR